MMSISQICIIILFQLYFLTIPTFGLSQIAEQRYMDDCFTSAKKSHSNLTSRFPKPLIKAHCRSSVIWKKEFLDSLARSATKTNYKPKPLTEAQKDWVTVLWKCRDPACLCMILDSCNYLMNNLMHEHEVSNLSTMFEQNLNEKQLSNAEEVHLRVKRQQVWQGMNDILRTKVTKVTRKEIRLLTDEERQKLFDAFNRLKREKIDNLSKYDIIILYHTPEYAPQAHFCAAFLPYHREILKTFEMALRTIDPNLALPYWDTTMDESLPDAKDSIMWSSKFFGNGFGDVITGPFANWTTLRDVRLGQLSKNNKIYRNLGAAPYSGLIRDQDILTLFNKNNYLRDFTYCVDQFFELVHGAGHLWIGGHMLELRVAPNDPVFFFYHSFIDSIWEQFRQTKQNRYQRENDYPDGNDACNHICLANQPMRPFPIKIIDGLSNAYTDYLFDFAPRPTCSFYEPECKSPYLFCNKFKQKCVSKIRWHGNCVGYDDADACYNGRCIKGRCIPDPPTTTTTSTTTTTTTTTIAPVVVDRGSETVWISITILATSTGDGSTRAHPNVVITTKDMATGRVFTGRTAETDQSRYYTGSAYAQVSNPLQSDRDDVLAVVEVSERNGALCSSMCHDDVVGYAPCEPAMVKLSKKMARNGVPFALSLDSAKDLSWEGNNRIPDKLMFLCSPSSIDPDTVATPQTPSNAPKSPGRSSNCLNNHRCCKIWIPTAEKCQKVHWLSKTCPRSCKICQNDLQDEDDEDICIDFNNKCPKWAANNQCTVNVHWMEENCRRSCNICDRPRETLKTLCGQAPAPKAREKKCLDLNAYCPAWAKSNECQKNTQWMTENCPKSCKMC